MNKHRCKVCTYIYDPAANNNVAFDDLPDDYICPVCGVGKDQFVIIHQLGEEYTGGEAQEKHVPVIEASNGDVEVKVCSVPHPMEEAHYITAVELYDGGDLIKKVELKPGDKPVTTFKGVQFSDNLKALAYCNLHGIWES